MLNPSCSLFLPLGVFSDWQLMHEIAEDKRRIQFYHEKGYSVTIFCDLIGEQMFHQSKTKKKHDLRSIDDSWHRASDLVGNDFFDGICWHVEYLRLFPRMKSSLMRSRGNFNILWQWSLSVIDCTRSSRGKSLREWFTLDIAFVEHKCEHGGFPFRRAAIIF